MAANTIDELRVLITASTSDFHSGVRGVKTELGSLETAMSKVSKVAKLAFVAAGAAIVGGLGAAVKSTATYQSSLSQLAQASGATGQEMESMAKLARQLGQDTDLAGVTASDAAKSMVELSKAGLSVGDTMDATKGVLSLAKAGNIDFAEAAVIAASALNAFGMEGKDASKVADMLAAGANASQADLADLALGMQASATVAKQFGLKLNDTVTALALFANNGIKGSDAGTSLKTMLIALAKPSVAAAEAMDAIGFSAYDAQGEFVGLSEMSKRLKKATEGLTDEQKQNTLATIFGTDAFRAAAVLADNAGTSYENMSTSVGKAGAAQQAAAAQMGPLQKSWEGFNNALSELGLAVGEKLAPHLTRATQAATEFVQKITAGLPQIIALVQSLIPYVATLTAGYVAYKTVVLLASGAAAAHSVWLALHQTQYVLLNGSLILVRTATVAQTVAQVALNTAMRLNPIGLVIGAAALLYTGLSFLANQTDSTKNATDRLKDAQERLRQSTDLAKDAQDRLKGALFSEEGAALAVERAQRSYNDAVEQFGPTALEAREAEFNLKRAKDEQKRATNEARVATQEMQKAEQNKARDTSLVASEQRNKDFIDRTTNSIGSQKNALFFLKNDLNGLNGSRFAYSVVGTYTTYEQKLQSTGSGVPFKMPSQRFMGGTVEANRPYIVGENPDGSLNRTSELFVPRTAGRIINSSELRSMISGGTNVSQSRRANTGDMQLNSVNHVTVNIGEETLVDRIVKGINNKTFMTNGTLIEV